MNSKIQILNQSLIHLGQTPIFDFDDGSVYSTIAAVFWAGAVDAVLRGHPWNFAARRQVLARLTEAPAFGYASAFARPADDVRVLEAGTTDYKIEGRLILCDETALTLRYISNQVSITEWDALFCEALSLYLAWKMAYPITKSEAVRDACWQAYVQLLVQGRSVDAQEEPSEDFGDSSLITVRG
jgi:hypothetical protein